MNQFNYKRINRGWNTLFLPQVHDFPIQIINFRARSPLDTLQGGTEHWYFTQRFGYLFSRVDAIGSDSLAIVSIGSIGKPGTLLF
jgi:hypothetical protein